MKRVSLNENSIKKKHPGGTGGGEALLCLETSTSASSLALVSREGMPARDFRGPAPGPHTADLFVRLKKLLEEGGSSLSGLLGVAVAAGPGSFTGLRVAVSAAKTLAWSTGLPLFAVDSLEALAFGSVDLKCPVCAIFNAGQGELYAGIYSPPRSGGSAMRRIMEPAALTLDALCLELDKLERMVLVGEGFLKNEQNFITRLGADRLVKAPERRHLPDAALVGELALKELERCRVQDLFGFEPFYVRTGKMGLRLNTQNVARKDTPVFGS
ncbi:MAG: tRNA (adenosine(37)-N6)-threonylcarbamoyltransferase complex dimerization subunit type 1 TsaB [Gemmatimonadota bacterium]|nr:tRNA (adenosine(37)-N6)-threonylcarbamoyltransferase complex dimerization subunit type 1 TsaB [Gemmatimonadota bacterium]